MANHSAKVISRAKNIKLYIYKCPLCLGYHLTSRKNYKGEDNDKVTKLMRKLRKALRKD